MYLYHLYFEYLYRTNLYHWVGDKNLYLSSFYGKIKNKFLNSGIKGDWEKIFWIFFSSLNSLFTQFCKKTLPLFIHSIIQLLWNLLDLLSQRWTLDFFSVCFVSLILLKFISRKTFLLSNEYIQQFSLCISCGIDSIGLDLGRISSKDEFEKLKKKNVNVN